MQLNSQKLRNLFNLKLVSLRKNIILVSSMLFIISGCADVTDSIIDNSFESVIDSIETKEERHIRKDKQRLRRGEPLKYYKSKDDLERHEDSLKSQEYWRERGGWPYDNDVAQ